MSVTTDPQRRPPAIHPGEFLREDYLPELQLSLDQFAKQLGTSQQELQAVLDERRAISPELAYRLALYFGTSPEFWMNLQTAFELNTIFHSNLDAIKREIQPRVAA